MQVCHVDRRCGICQPVWGTDLHLLLSGGLLRLGLVDPGRSGRAVQAGRPAGGWL